MMMMMIMDYIYIYILHIESPPTWHFKNTQPFRNSGGGGNVRVAPNMFKPPDLMVNSHLVTIFTALTIISDQIAIPMDLSSIFRINSSHW